MSCRSSIWARQCLAVLLALCEFAHTVPPELPPKVAELLGRLPASHQLSEHGELTTLGGQRRATSEELENLLEAEEEEDYSEESHDYVDPRFWKSVERWREERDADYADYRRLSHNNAEGDSAPRHATVHLHWKAPSGQSLGEVNAWYTEAIVTSYHEDSFFAVNGHNYGYMGIECIDYSPFRGRVSFSIYDNLCTGNDLGACPPENRTEITKCGDNVTCTRFGDAGTGAKGYIEWDDWKVNTVFSFLTVAKKVTDQQAEYTGYFYSPDFNNGTWQLMASLKFNFTDEYWYIRGSYAYIEQTSTKNPEGIRWAKFGPIFKRSGSTIEKTAWWDPVVRARLYQSQLTSVDTTHNNWNKSTFVMEMGLGGDITTDTGTAHDDYFTVLPTLSCSTPLTEWVDADIAATLPTGEQPTSQLIACGRSTAANTCPDCGSDSAVCRGDCQWTSSNSSCHYSWESRRRSCRRRTCTRRLTRRSTTIGSTSSCRRRACEARRLLANDQDQVKCHEGGISPTYAPAYGPISIQVLTVSLTIRNVDYSQLTASPTKKYDFEKAVKSAIIQEASSSDDSVLVVLSSGSVVATVQIIPAVGQTPATVQTTLSSSATLTSNVLTGINAISGISSVSSGTIAVDPATFTQNVVSTAVDDMSRTYFFLAHVNASPRLARLVLPLPLSVLALGVHLR